MFSDVVLVLVYFKVFDDFGCFAVILRVLAVLWLLILFWVWLFLLFVFRLICDCGVLLFNVLLLAGCFCLPFNVAFVLT